MARNISGVYSLPAGSLVSNGDVSDAADLNTPLSDIESDLNAARPIVAGGTGATTAADARTNLGLAIGTNVQAYDAGLQSIAGLTTAADRMIYTTASDTYAVTTLTSFARDLLDDTDAATVRTTIGAQASDAALTSLAGLSLSAGDVLYATGADTLARLGIGTAGQVLKVNSGATAPEWAAAGYTWASEQATTSGTAFDFTGIPSTVREIVVAFDNTGLTGTDSILVQLIDGGGAQTTGYIARGDFSSTPGGASTNGFNIVRGLANDSVAGQMTLVRMGTSTRWTASHAMALLRSGSGHTGLIGGGLVALDDACVGVRVTRSGTNTFNSGAVIVGYR